MRFFAIRRHQSAMGTRVSTILNPTPEPHSHRLPHPIPLGCPRGPALSVLCHASNLHWMNGLCFLWRVKVASENNVSETQGLQHLEFSIF